MDSIGHDVNVTEPTTIDFLARQREREAARQGAIPTWRRRAQDGALYGYDVDGKPVAGKDLTGVAA